MFFINLFMIFLLYSFLGWLIEVTYVYYDKKVLVNRGFMFGPYCPIYGFGSIIITIFLTKYYSHPLVVFFESVLICLILEYTTSYILEILFNEKWWDYKDRKYNINGRVCLETLLPFGIFSIVSLYLIDPIFNNLLNLINPNTLIIITLLLFVLYIIDSVTSIYIKIKLKKIDYEYKYNSYVRKLLNSYINKNNISKYKRVNEDE